MANTVNHDPVSPPPPNTLAAKFGETLAWAIERAGGALGIFMGEMLAKGMKTFLEEFEVDAIAVGKAYMQTWIDNPATPPELRQYLQEISTPGHQATGPLNVAGKIMLTTMGFMGMAGPAMRYYNYKSDRTYQTARADPAILTRLWQKGLLAPNEVLESLRDEGWPDAYQSLFQRVYENVPAVGEIATAMFRGTISETEAQDRLRKLGYNEADTALLQSIFPVLPGVSDLISMAVKEAFTPEIAERFGQYQDFPPRFAEEAAKQGLSTEWARAYWAAHWDLPSPTQGFEMLHRGLITSDDLKLLLRALDVMPFWREKLVGISYNPYTRVDTRRMFDGGIIDRAGVKRSYLDQGYDEEHAENLTLWTTKERKDEERDLTKAEVLNGMIYGLLTEDEVKQRLTALRYSPQEADFYIALKQAQSAGRGKTPERALQKADLFAGYLNGLLTRNELAANLRSLGYDAKEVDLLLTLADQEKDKPAREANKALAKGELLSAYRDRIIDRSRAITLLTDIGYDVAEVEFLIGMADYQIERDRIDDQVSTLHVLYVNGFKTEQEVMTALNAFNLPDTTTQNLLYKWGFERDKRVERPTLSQLIQFHKARIIDQPTLVTELQGLGYPDRYIGWYVELIRKQTTPPA